MDNNVHNLKTENEQKRDMSDTSYFYGGLSADHLKQYIERIERLEDEKNSISEDLKLVFGEAKGSGFCIKTMKEILKLRKMDENERDEREYLIDTYKRALGMTPLEEFAEKQKQNAKLSIDVPDGTLENILKAGKATQPIIKILKIMYGMGGFRTNAEGDTALANKLIELKLLKQPKPYDNLFLLTAKSEKLINDL